MEEQLDRIAKALEGDEPEVGTPLECIAHALESIAESMNPAFRRLYTQRADFADSLREAREVIMAAQRLQDSGS